MMPHVVVGAGEVLQRIADCLRSEVSPRVDDSYAAAQVEAAVAVLEQLAAQVSWKPALLSAEVSAVQDALTALGSPKAGRLADDLESLASLRAALAEELRRADLSAIDWQTLVAILAATR